MNKKAIIALLSGLAALCIVNMSILKKETLLQDGETIFLKLAPVDPRSLIQGDYMALRFDISNDIRLHLQQQNKGASFPPQDGVVVVTLTDNSVGKFNRMSNTQELAANERVLQYRIRNNQVKFATNAFFFQEGSAEIYEKAEYGEFRTAQDGDLLLTGLRDESLVKLGPYRK